MPSQGENDLNGLGCTASGGIFLHEAEQLGQLGLDRKLFHHLKISLFSSLRASESFHCSLPLFIPRNVEPIEPGQGFDDQSILGTDFFGEEDPREGKGHQIPCRELQHD